jgi:hypothetical protein
MRWLALRRSAIKRHPLRAALAIIANQSKVFLNPES